MVPTVRCVAIRSKANCAALSFQVFRAVRTGRHDVNVTAPESVVNVMTERDTGLRPAKMDDALIAQT